MGKKMIARADIDIQKSDVVSEFEDDGVHDIKDQAREALEDALDGYDEFNDGIEFYDLTVTTKDEETGEETSHEQETDGAEKKWIHQADPAHASYGRIGRRQGLSIC